MKVVRSTGLTERQWWHWHAKVIDVIGPTQYLEIADVAMTGKEPKTLFSYLLKEEMDLQ